MASPPDRRIASGALAFALLLGGSAAAIGCSGGGDDDISKDTFLQSFSKRSPLNADIDRCIVDQLYENLDQEQLNGFWGKPGTPLSAENTEALGEASAHCNTEAVSELVPGTGPDTTETGMGPDTTPSDTQPSTDPAG